MLGGFLIALFSCVGLGSIVTCVYIKCKNYHMKKSDSMEELSSVDVTDSD